MPANRIRSGPEAIDPQQAASRNSRVVVVGIACAVLTGVLTTVQDVLESRTPEIDIGFGWSALHTSWLAAMFGAFLGLTVLQRPRLDRFGRIATTWAVVSTGAMAVMAAYEAVTLYAGRDPSQGDPPLPVLVVILVAYAAYVLGVLLFSVATFRTQVLPRPAAVVLIAAVAIKLAFGDLFGPLAFLGIAVAGLGLSAAWVVRRDRVGPV